MIPDRRQLLGDTLRMLKVRYPNVPKLGDICSDHGVAIRYVDNARRPTLCEDGPARYRVHLPVQHRGSPQERFWIAHELAHYFLLASGDAVPATKSEYWKLEDVCNEFARDLLASENIARTALAREGRTAAGYLRASTVLAAACNAPWLQMATWMSHRLDSCRFLRITMHGSDRLKVSGSTFPKKSEIGRFVPHGTAFHTAVRRALNSDTSEIVAIGAGELQQAEITSLAACLEGVVQQETGTSARVSLVVGGDAARFDSERSKPDLGADQISFAF